MHRSDSALGAFLRRKKSHLGSPKAITATAHKLARIVYRMLRYGQHAVDDAGPVLRESVSEEGAQGRQAESGATGLPAGPDGRRSRPRIHTGHIHTGFQYVTAFVIP